MASHAIGEGAVVREVPHPARYGPSVEIARKSWIAVQGQKEVVIAGTSFKLLCGPGFTVVLI